MLCTTTSESRVSLQENPKLLALFQDAQFREDLEARPIEVLGRYGVHLEEKDLPEKVRLPEMRALGAEQLWMGLI